MMTLGDLLARNDPTKGREALEARTPHEWCRGGWHGLKYNERLVGAGGRKRCVDRTLHFVFGIFMLALVPTLTSASRAEPRIGEGYPLVPHFAWYDDLSSPLRT